MSRKLWTLTAVFALAVAVLAPMSAVGAADPSELQVPGDIVAEINDGKEAQVYIVITLDDPVVAYEGGTAGLPATKPNKGRKVNPNSAAVRKYVDHLEATHDAALESVGAEAGDKLYSYAFSVSGFAATLTEAQATALALQDGILFVAPDEMQFIQTENTPDYLGITDPGGPWPQGSRGEDVIVGVIDTGIWPEHPSFADNGTYGRPPAGWAGTGCDFGNTAFNPNDAAFTCNNKLLAATSYGLGFHGGTGAGLDPGEYLSARDADGHGTHTTSTAAGNSGVAASILGNDFGDVSGIAPRARVSMYKACWDTTPTTGGCSSVDLVAAIDQAVADGVDVINYSIGSTSFAIGADDISFLFADAAGVFVATSAGNSGPGSATVFSPATVPWVTSVGANTQNREYLGSIDTGDAASYTGVTITAGTAAGLDLVDAADHGNELCNPAVSFTSSVAGKIVLCQRGVFARVAKSQAVFLGGGAGMVLYNVSDTDTLNTDNHYVPSVHINNTDGLAVKAYIAGAGAPTGTIQGGAFTATPGSVMAAFSSRGPNLLTEDIIKPDVTAPGVNVLAGNSPTALLGAPGQLFQSISGTSMSSPHVAGLFALLKQEHPDWSPAIAKSALMTTARQDVVKEDGATPADPFDMGAGHIAPGGVSTKGSVLEPGLAYDAGLFEYAAYTCGANLGVFTAGTCAFLEGIGIPTDPSDLNLASIGVAELVGTQTVTRTVTSVTRENAKRTYSVAVDPPPGFSVSVSPSSLTLKKGETATYEVTITNTGATLGTWSFGSLTWSDDLGFYDVRSPIAVRAFEFAGDAEVHGTGTVGSVDVDVAFGYVGDYSTGSHGLVAATETVGNVVDDPANNINVALGTGIGVTFHLIPIAADNDLARFSLFDAFTDGNDDLDLYIFGPDTAGFPFVGGSGSATSAEQVDVPFAAPGDYLAVVHGWQTDGPDANYTLFSWDVGADAGNLTVTGAPATVAVGDAATLNVSWAGLAPLTKYLGVISHHNTAAPAHGPDPSVIGQTIIAVDS